MNLDSIDSLHVKESPLDAHYEIMMHAPGISFIVATGFESEQVAYRVIESALRKVSAGCVTQAFYQLWEDDDGK